jgi:hypothetical protein
LAAAHCWQLLLRASRDRRSPWRTPVLSTRGLDGSPQARILVLRSVELTPGLLWLHTDMRSAKVAELAAEPRVALTFHDGRRALQLRVDGVARLETGPRALAEAWERVPEPARRNYSTVDPPGSLVDGAVRYTGDGEANFRMIAIRAERLEWLWLGPDLHRRGESRRSAADGDWAAQGLVP